VQYDGSFLGTQGSGRVAIGGGHGKGPLGIAACGLKRLDVFHSLSRERGVDSPYPSERKFPMIRLIIVGLCMAWLGICQNAITGNQSSEDQSTSRNGLRPSGHYRINRARRCVVEDQIIQKK
jgi:hypothetical protein